MAVTALPKPAWTPFLARPPITLPDGTALRGPCMRRWTGSKWEYRLMTPVELAEFDAGQD